MAYFELTSCNDGDVFLSENGRCFTTGEEQQHDADCVITALENVVLTVVWFNTEARYDFMTIDGTVYEGTDSPDGVAVLAGETIEWESDTWDREDGFEICSKLLFFLVECDDEEAQVSTNNYGECIASEEGAYGTDINCYATAMNDIALSVIAFDVEDGADFLQYNDADGNLIQEFTGAAGPDGFFLTEGEALVFVTDAVDSSSTGFGICGVERDNLGLELVGGTTAMEGNVYLHGRPVCDDSWDDNAATVLCKELGYASGTMETKSNWGEVDDTEYVMTDVICNGTETSIWDCDFTHYINAEITCGADEGAGAYCVKKDDVFFNFENIGYYILILLGVCMFLVIFVACTCVRSRRQKNRREKEAKVQKVLEIQPGMGEGVSVERLTPRTTGATGLV